MKWRKSPDELIQAFDHCLPIVAGVQRKAMFGYPCAFVNGHLFCGLHQDSLIVHLSEAHRDVLVANGASVFEPMPGRAMKEYVVVPPDIVADREKLRALLGEALAHASSLAPEAQKPTKAKKPTAAKKKAPPPKRKVAPARKAAPTPKRKAAPAPKRKAAPTPKRKAAPAKKAKRKASPKKKRSR